MGLIAALILTVWLLGIVLMTLSIGSAFKHNTEDPSIQQLRLIAEHRPASVALAVTVLVVFWPASLGYAFVTRNKGK